jgi:hypothetical protein
MSGQDQYGDYDYTRRSSGSSGEYESQQDYNGRSGDASQYGSRSGTSGYGARRAESSYGRGTEDSSYGRGTEDSSYGRGSEDSSYGRGSEDSTAYGTRTSEQQAGEYGQPAEYGAREYRSYRRGEYRPRSDYSRSGEYPQTGYGRRGSDLGTGGGEPPRTRGDVIGVIASSLFAVLAVLALVAVVYIVINGNQNDSPTTASQPSQSNEPTGSNEPSGGQSTAPAEKAPVIVLNSTDRSGLAADASDAIKAEDWETGEPGNYAGGELPESTVFYPKGMKGSAQLLQEDFPDITAVKSAEQGMSTSSLTLVLGSDWP